MALYLPAWSVDLVTTRNRTWPRLLGDDAEGETAYQLTSLPDGKREYILSRRKHDVSALRNRDISATIGTRPESLITSDRSLACSDHGENQRQRNHNCAPAQCELPEGCVFLLLCNYVSLLSLQI